MIVDCGCHGIDIRGKIIRHRYALHYKTQIFGGLVERRMRRVRHDDLNSPQLWIDKDLRVPVRLIYTEKDSGDKIDIRLLGFQSDVVGRWSGDTDEQIKLKKLKWMDEVLDILFRGR